MVTFVQLSFLLRVTLEESGGDGSQVELDSSHPRNEGKVARLQMKPSLALYYDFTRFI